MLAPWKKSYDQPRQHIQKQRRYFANQGPSSQSYGFSNSHVWMWELNYKEIWALKNWCFWTVVLEKTLESPLDCKEIQPVHPKGNQSWVFIGRTDAEAETSTLWPLMQRTDSYEKTLMLGKIEGRRRKGWQRMRWLNGITDLMDVSLSELIELVMTGKPGMLQFMRSQRVGHDWATDLIWRTYWITYRMLLCNIGKESKKEQIYVYYNWFTLLYSRNWYNIVNKLYSNKNSFKKKPYDKK